MPSNICADIDEPILFRTTSNDVYKTTIETGSLWLRSGQYFRELEDKVRSDKNEGVNIGKITFPLSFKVQDGLNINIEGKGIIGQEIRPHYILSLHGSSISATQLRSFGENTFGIRSLSKLSAEVLLESSKILKNCSCRYGAIAYQYSAFALSHNPIGGSAMKLRGEPPLYLNPAHTDILRKEPVVPFTEQDEWRIAIFTEKHLNDDPNVPLKINVNPGNFYPYERQ